uniref:Uncharacterized protein AlNc14C37G3237 n=1 Tax=Albugo laibachii Nc14 TaxID=890382 RepID=F0W8W2_9STRA|nr:conserved hypothetical protein [Albugo laibachii Nc14]|eukprot:CCA17573.1 conserved hypothetical protein [Albugo laibachii Nc14]
MGNEQSSRGGRSRAEGVFFVSWKNGGYHFAEPSSYRYDKVSRMVCSNLVYTSPPKADGELRNASQLLGNIAVIERGGRLHFPDIVRWLLSAGAVACIFLEHGEEKDPMATQTLFDGFHSSGRQSIPIPIVLFSKYHTDCLIRDQPVRVTIELLSSEEAIKHVVPHDLNVAVAVAARAGEVELLKHVLYADTSGAVLEVWMQLFYITMLQGFRLPKAIALCDAVENGHIDCIELLHGFGISLDEQKPNGTSPLMVACSIGNLEAARALLMYRASLDLEDIHGMTALTIAARDNRFMCLKLLIRKGARVNLSTQRTRGTTALHAAARCGHDEIVSTLIEAGAGLDIQSPNATTALMEAARAGHLGCVRLLVNAGADVQALDREGQIAEILARDSGHTEVEDYLHERAESESSKDYRRRLDDVISAPDLSIKHLIELVSSTGAFSVESLIREITRDSKAVEWILQSRIVYDVLSLLTSPAKTDEPLDTLYGQYKSQYICCEIATWYGRSIFVKNSRSNFSGIPQSGTMKEVRLEEEFDLARSYGYLKALFNFLCQPGPLDNVILVLFCNVVNAYILKNQLGKLLQRFLADDGQPLVPRIVCHIGSDSIRDTIVWLFYSDMSDMAQRSIRSSKFLECTFERLCSWQRTLSWGVGTTYQRDSVENICVLMNYILSPPCVYMMGDHAAFVNNNDQSLPLITDQYYPQQHNALLKTLLTVFQSPDVSIGALIELGFSEIERQARQKCVLTVHEGGALSIVMMLMKILGYHKKKHDFTGVENLVKETQRNLLLSLLPRVGRFVQLCRTIVSAKEEKASNAVKGSVLLYLITFFRRCVSLQSSHLDSVLANSDLMPCLLSCFDVQPNNSLMHHELTDIIRCVLLDPDQKRLPTCPLLNSLFSDTTSILDFVMKSFQRQDIQYRGHMTIIANSIFTLANTPAYTGEVGHVSCQNVVHEYARKHQDWAGFRSTLAKQNLVQTQPLGERNAPLCDGCLSVKEFAVEYVQESPVSDIDYSGYLETLFTGTANHYCKVNNTEDFTAGFLFKKDKMHDHIPIPEPNKVNSFIQFPVPMPFHALTFTITYFGLCRKCGKLWYCDTLNNPNWTTRVKWVIPTSANKWYSFGLTEGPGSGAHGIQFATKGYKSFIVLCDTWGRQEQWMQALQDAISVLSVSAARRMDAANAMAIDIDNEVDTDQWNISPPTDKNEKDRLRKPSTHTKRQKGYTIASTPSAIESTLEGLEHTSIKDDTCQSKRAVCQEAEPSHHHRTKAHGRIFKETDKQPIRASLEGKPTKGTKQAAENRKIQEGKLSKQQSGTSFTQILRSFKNDSNNLASSIPKMASSANSFSAPSIASMVPKHTFDLTPKSMISHATTSLVSPASFHITLAKRMWSSEGSSGNSAGSTLPHSASTSNLKQLQ